MKAVLLDVMNDKVEVVDAEELEDYYKLIGCRTIEIVNWEIMGRRFDIVCDEEGLFFENFLKIRKFHLLMINAM